MRNFIERRRSIRANTDLIAAEVGAPYGFKYPVANLSRAGMYIYVSGSTCHIGRYVTLDVSIPGLPASVRVRGEVVRRNVNERFDTAGIGLRFMDLHGESRDAIHGYVNRVVSGAEFEARA